MFVVGLLCCSCLDSVVGDLLDTLDYVLDCFNGCVVLNGVFPVV